MKNNITLETILEKVCQHFELNQDDVKSKRKYGNIPLARQIFFYISRKTTDNKLEWIGHVVNKDHCNVIFSVNKIDSQKFYPNIQSHLKDIWNLIFVPEIVIEDVDLLKLSENYTRVLK